MRIDPAATPADQAFSFRLRYETLRALLRRNGYALQLISDLEADLNHLPQNDLRIHRPIEHLLNEVLLMAQELNLLSRRRHEALYRALERIRQDVNAIFSKPFTPEHSPLLVRLDEERSLDSAIVGGKAASVSLLYRTFPGSVPDGFTVTTAAYNLFLEENHLADRIRLLLKDLDVTADQDRFHMTTDAVRGMIRTSEVPDKVREAIREHARKTAASADGWAVRSSARFEDGKFSFAGQFDTLLNVKTEELAEAYLKVLAGRFSDRAVLYRLNCGIREVDTPMAVLFLPMIDPRAAGVIRTSDPSDARSPRMVINAVPGLGDKVVKGIGHTDAFYLSREASPELLKYSLTSVAKSGETFVYAPYLDQDALRRIGSLGYSVARALGHDLDIEWALDKKDKVWLLQARRFDPTIHETVRDTRDKIAAAIIEGGAAIFAGRAEGRAFVWSEGSSLQSVPKASVLVVDKPTPDLAPLLPRLSALLAAEGSPASHLATLLREFSVPSIFQLSDKIKPLSPGAVISVDATKRKVYEGSRWPEMRELVASRLDAPLRRGISSPLHDLVLSLNLTDPFSSDFKPGRCRSLHDAIRFIHEMSVRAMFDFGDDQNRFWTGKAKRLKTNLPLKIRVIELDERPARANKEISPEEILGPPFQAFWSGLADKELFWPERWDQQFAGLPGDFREQVLGGARGPRKTRDTNYLMVARDYLNFNARFAYHYAMVDALLTPGDHNNYVHFRFHNGGASDKQRERRARFIERVLRESRFGVDRRGDLLTAWFRRYSRVESENALRVLGRLMVCARQLDLLMISDDDIKMFADHFIAGDFRSFSR